MFSERFGKSIVITDHARGRMAARAISETLLHDIIDTGELRGTWFVDRCSFPDPPVTNHSLAAVLETALVIKTVMHHFSWESGS